MGQALNIKSAVALHIPEVHPLGDLNPREIEERFKMLEQRLVNLDAKFMGQIAVARDRHLLTNDRIDEAFDIIKMLEKREQ